MASLKLYDYSFFLTLLILLLILESSYCFIAGPALAPRNQNNKPRHKQFMAAAIPLEMKSELSFAEKIVQAMERPPLTYEQKLAKDEEKSEEILSRIQAKQRHDRRLRKDVQNVVQKLKSFHNQKVKGLLRATRARRRYKNYRH